MKIGILDLSELAESRVRASNGGDPNFYKFYDIKRFGKKEFPTMLVDSQTEVSKYDYFYNN